MAEPVAVALVAGAAPVPDPRFGRILLVEEY
jgi:hypothetical protein